MINLINLSSPPNSWKRLQKPTPSLSMVHFASSFIWCRRPCDCLCKVKCVIRDRLLTELFACTWGRKALRHFQLRTSVMKKIAQNLMFWSKILMSRKFLKCFCVKHKSDVDWQHAFQSTLNSPIVSYRIVSYDTVRRHESLTWTGKLSIQLYLAQVARNKKPSCR